MTAGGPAVHWSADAEVSPPDLFDWCLALGLVLLMFALETYVAVGIGRSQSLAYDGLGYAAHARTKYFQLQTLLRDPWNYLGGFLHYIAPLWSVFIVGTYLIADIGEIQASLALFWPILFLLLLVIWTVRLLADRTLATLLALFTAALPLASPNLALVVTYQLGFDWLGYMQTNLADPRPDLLGYVFMLWSVVLLLLKGRDAGRATFIMSAVMASLSALTKTTTAPLTLGCWGLAILYVVWLRRDRLRETAVSALPAAAILGLLLAPWVAAGGLRLVLNYIRDAYAWKPFYDRSATEAGLHHFAFHRYILGAHLHFSWPVIGLMVGVAALAIACNRGRSPRPRTLLAGLGLAAIWILIPLYVEKLRNHVLALPLYLTLWLLFAAAASDLWRRYGSPQIRTAVAGSLALGIAATACTGLAGVRAWPQEDLRRLLRGRDLIREIAGDVALYLTSRDTFAGLVLASGWPMILQFHMTRDASGHPASFRFWPPDGPAIAGDAAARQRFIADLETQAKLIVTFKEPPEQVYRQARMSDFFLPHFNALHEYLNSGRSRYRPVREYVFPPPGRFFFPPAAGTVVMYLRDDVPSRF